MDKYKEHKYKECHVRFLLRHTYLFCIAMAHVERRFREIDAPCTMTLEEMQDVVQQVLQENELSIARQIPGKSEHSFHASSRKNLICLTNGQAISIEEPYSSYNHRDMRYYTAIVSVDNSVSSGSKRVMSLIPLSQPKQCYRRTVWLEKEHCFIIKQILFYALQ
jgi:hypothetical protein